MKRMKWVAVLLGMSIFLVFAWATVRAYQSVVSISEYSIPAMQDNDIYAMSTRDLAKAVESYKFTLDEYDGNYLYGQTFFESLSMIVPRSIWSSKSIGYARMLKMDLTPGSGGNTVPTIIGELFMNFGSLGIVVGMAVLGMFSKFLYVKLIGFGRSAVPPGNSLIYASCIPAYLDLIWGGSNPAAWDFWFKILPIISVVLFARIRGTRSEYIG